jgi:hypothetical protein
MKIPMKLLSSLLMSFLLISCNSKQNEMERIIFLHHSTGQAIWYGKTNRYIRKLTNRSDVKTFFNNYNRKNKTRYYIAELSFPKGAPYGWANFPYDYYNIWVKNVGEEPFMGEPNLEILTKEFDIIIFKHCYPVSSILEDTGTPDIDSDEKRIENYKLQYDALKNKMHEFPNNKFIVWTPAVKVKNKLTPEEAQRTNDFYNWVINKWDQKGDNIYIWDFYKYETEGGLYLLDNYASGSNDSHPNKQFSGRIAPLFSQFIIDVAEGKIE